MTQATEQTHGSAARDPLFGWLDHPTANAALIGLCGDKVEFYLAIRDGVIADVRYYSEGCDHLRSRAAAVARRDKPGREGKQFVGQDVLTDHIAALLDDIHNSMFERAVRFRDERTVDVADYGELVEAVKTGFARAPWAGTGADEEKIQNETKATIRVIPFDQPGKAGRCVATGVETDQVAIFGRSY